MNEIQTRYAKVTEEVDAVMAAQAIALAHLNSGTDEYRKAAKEWRSSQGIDFVPMLEAKGLAFVALMAFARSQAIAAGMSPATAAEVWRPSVKTAQSLAAAAMELEREAS
jgi:hypothetical protein